MKKRIGSWTMLVMIFLIEFMIRKPQIMARRNKQVPQVRTRPKGQAALVKKTI